MVNDEPIKRSALLVMAFELEGLCNSLRITVPNGLAPSRTTIAIMNKLLEEFSEKADGVLLDNLPPLDEKTSPVDVLIVAEILRSTLTAFLSPEELHERERTFGFAARPNNPEDQDKDQ